MNNINNNIDTPAISEGTGSKAEETAPMNNGAAAGTGEGGNCPEGETYTFVEGMPAFGIEDSWQCLAEDDNGMAQETEEPVEEQAADEGQLCADGYSWDDTYVWYKDGVAYTGACLPVNFSCGDNMHWQPSGNGEDGECVMDAISEEVAEVDPQPVEEKVAEEGKLDEEFVEEVMAAAGPTFTPVVDCCTTDLGNAIVSGLLENYRSELETIY